MEKPTLTPFSYRGRGSAFSNQYTSCLPSASRFVSDSAGGGALVLGGFGELALAVLRWVLAAFLGGGDLSNVRASHNVMS
jgi:hypothetical protein